jgi:hypothetical protein
MDKQFGETRPAHGESPGARPQAPASRPTNQFPAEISHANKVQPMSAELDAIQNKLNRMMSKPEWNDKQFKTVLALMRQRESIVNPGWREELEQFVETLKPSSSEE